MRSTGVSSLGLEYHEVQIPQDFDSIESPHETLKFSYSVSTGLPQFADS